MALFSSVARDVLDGVVLGPTFPLRHVSHLARRPLHTTTLRRGGTVTFRTGSSDAETFIDIFRRGAYDFSWLQQYGRVLAAYQRIIDRGRAPIIIDAGANVGAASVWFGSQFPQARIYSVEPDPENAAVLRINARTRPNIEVIEAAIGSQRGTVALKNPQGQGWAVQTERTEGGGVPVTTIPEILAARNEASELFLVKVDIEGFEADLFEDNLGWLDQVEVLIIEPHDWMLPGAGTSRNFQKAMLARSFEMVISGENLVYLRV